jgi:hypothetical protein
MSTLIISPYEQGTEEWLNDRLGRATGSRAGDITAKGKSKGLESVTRRNYRFQLALERITRKQQGQVFVNEAMARGTELEPLARQAYELHSGNLVNEAGFCYPSDALHYGCSVDGFVDADGIIEIKCPSAPIHYGYLEDGVVPSNYKGQVLHNLLTTGRTWCDFVSYHPDFPEKLQLFIVRYHLDFNELVAYQDELNQFLVEVEDLTNEILRKAA